MCGVTGRHWGLLRQEANFLIPCNTFSRWQNEDRAGSGRPEAICMKRSPLRYTLMVTRHTLVSHVDHKMTQDGLRLEEWRQNMKQTTKPNVTFVTCHAKTRPSAHFIILRKTITNTEHERSIEFEFFIYHESTMTHLRGDTFEIFI